MMEEKLAGTEEQVVAQPLGEQPETELPTSSFADKLKAHKFKILGGVLGVLIFIGAVFGAYKLGQRQLQLQPSPSPETAVSPSPDPTADWQTYTSNRGGYEIKYPKEGEIEEVGEPEKFMCVHVKIGRAFLRIKTPEGNYGGCIVTGVEKPGEPIQETVRILGNEQTASGMKTILETEHWEFLRVENVGGIEGFILEYGDESINSEDHQEDKEKIYLMLSTFKFLEVSETQDWKTYTNESYGFQIKYPGEMVLGPEPKAPDPELLSSRSVYHPEAVNSIDEGQINITVRSTSLDALVTSWEKLASRTAIQVSLDGLVAKEIDWVNNNKTDGINLYNQKILLAHNSLTYEISLYVDDNNPEKEEFLGIFNQMLSSFHFLD